MVINMNGCIHQIEIDGQPMTKEQLESIIDEGLVDIRMFGFDKGEVGSLKRYFLMRFAFDDISKLEDVHTAIADFRPVYCFNDVCPRTTFACPAHRPADP